MPSVRRDGTVFFGAAFRRNDRVRWEIFSANPDERSLSQVALSTPTSALERIADPARWPHQTVALACRNIGSGRKRAAFWPALGFPNLVLTRAAKANKRRLRWLEEWKREELQLTPFAILDEPPDELRPVKKAAEEVIADRG